MMKGIKNKYFKSILCLGVGAVVLSAAVFANYDNANGYEACKTALKNMLFQDNFTLDSEISVAIDGQKLITEKFSNKVAEGADVYYQTTASHENYIDNSSSYSKNTHQDRVNITEHGYSDGVYSKYMTPSYRNKDNMALAGSDDMTAKFINFAEVVADTMVGDLKNSFVLTSKDDNTRTYTISLSAEQLPEIVTSGVSLMVGAVEMDRNNSQAVNGSYGSEAEDQLFDNFFGGERDPYIDQGTLVVTLNNDDTLADMSGTLTLCGFDGDNNQHNVTLNLSAGAYSYGTTAIAREDTADAEMLPGYDEEDYTISVNGETIIGEE